MCVQNLQHGKRTTVLQQSDWNVLAAPVQEAYRLSGNGDDLTKQNHAKHHPGAHPVHQRTAHQYDNQADCRPRRQQCSNHG